MEQEYIDPTTGDASKDPPRDLPGGLLGDLLANLPRDLPQDLPTEITEDSPHIGRIVYQIQESRSEEAYQAYCPELLITAFGDSPELAKEALRAQVIDYLEDCDSLGALDEVLIEAGFYFDGEAWLSNEVYPVGDPKIRIFGTSPDHPFTPESPESNGPSSGSEVS